MDSGDNVYVADGWVSTDPGGNSRIQVFDSSGGCVRTFGSGGTGNGQFANPWAVAANASGTIIYVADSRRWCASRPLSGTERLRTQ